MPCFWSLVARRRGAPFLHTLNASRRGACGHSSPGGEVLPLARTRRSQAVPCLWALVARRCGAPILHALVARRRGAVLVGTRRPKARCSASARTRRSETRCRTSAHLWPEGAVLRFCTQSSLGGAESCFWEPVARRRGPPLLHSLVAQRRGVVLQCPRRTNGRCSVFARSHRSEARSRASRHSSPEDEVLRVSTHSSLGGAVSCFWELVARI